MSNSDSSHAVSSFRTTCWTDVLTAREQSPAAESSFSRLYRDYWPPLYGYLRRRGLSHAEAEDITQDFFSTLIAKERLAHVQREGGRFRSFLLTAMQNFLANVWDRKNAAKRGGGATPLSLEDSSSGIRIEVAGKSVLPEVLFDREWALLVLKRALNAMEAEFIAGNKEKLFAVLRPQLQGDRGGRPYSVLAQELGMTEGAVKTTVHRMRHRYGELLRQEIQRTVDSPEDVQDELRHLLQIIGTGIPETAAEISL